VTPPAQLASEKQRRLCLVSRHLTCATYQAATGVGAIAANGHHDDRSALARPPLARPARPMARTTPLVLDHGRIAIGVPALRGQGAGLGQSALIGLMAVAFGAILVARLSGAGGPSDGGLIAGAADGTARPSLEIAVAPEGSGDSEAPARTLVPTDVDPTDEPSETTAAESELPDEAAPPDEEAPAAEEEAKTYKVKRGDTLSGIAAEFGTTVRKLAKLNDIEDPSRLKVGQVLQLP
jgi:LysM repeat protein